MQMELNKHCLKDDFTRAWQYYTHGPAESFGHPIKLSPLRSAMRRLHMMEHDNHDIKNDSITG